jgi:hypothetical protein
MNNRYYDEELLKRLDRFNAIKLFAISRLNEKE